MGKWRVICRTFKEYVQCSKDYTTNVHTVYECDVWASDSMEALQQALNAFGLNGKSFESSVKYTSSAEPNSSCSGSERKPMR